MQAAPSAERRTGDDDVVRVETDLRSVPCTELLIMEAKDCLEV